MTKKQLLEKHPLDRVIKLSDEGFDKICDLCTDKKGIFRDELDMVIDRIKTIKDRWIMAENAQNITKQEIQNLFKFINNGPNDYDEYIG